MSEVPILSEHGKNPWIPVEGTAAELAVRGAGSFPALAEGRIPAVIVRGAFPLDQCRAVVRRLYERGVILERKGQTYDAVGTSLVNLGADPEAFFASARATHALFA